MKSFNCYHRYAGDTLDRLAANRDAPPKGEVAKHSAPDTTVTETQATAVAAK